MLAWPFKRLLGVFLAAIRGLGAVVNEFFTPINHAVIPHFFESGIDAVYDIFVKSKRKIIP